MIFDWDDSNRQHLARHQVKPAEAEEVIRSEPVELEVEEHDDGDRPHYVGETATGRVLVVIITWRGDAVRIISGWDAPRAIKQQYLTYRANEYGR